MMKSARNRSGVQNLLEIADRVKHLAEQASPEPRTKRVAVRLAQVLLAATIVMSLIVVTMNRTLWQRLYRLAATRYKLET